MHKLNKRNIINRLYTSRINSETKQSSKQILESLVGICSAFEDVCILSSNNSPNSSKNIFAGIGSLKTVKSDPAQDSFEVLNTQISKSGNWWLGHFAYDLKNEIELLKSENSDNVGFPTLSFFNPEFVIQLEKEQLTIESYGKKSASELFDITPTKKSISTTISIQARTTKEAYIKNVTQLLSHIQKGDIYEINYCIEFFAIDVSIDPGELFLKLNSLTEAPFSALYKNDNNWLICGSPERFIEKKGTKISSQPIKGTRPRGKTNEEDNLLKAELLNDPKERSENVMIVDIVRNDLSRSAQKGTVKVEELFGIHTFKNVHQMISTISCELDSATNPIEAIKNAFPMGSMTGAPKVKAMELAEKFENVKRGLYAGALGYFTPTMDFDFNVIIRSIQYNSKTGYLSLMVGSAITANSIPEKEYDECLVKAETLFQALGVFINE